jgi:hypothetical protein
VKEFAEMANPLAETYLNEANKLDGSNFVNWKFKMQTLMEGYGVWTITKGDEARPDASAGATMKQSKIGISGRTKPRYYYECL